MSKSSGILQHNDLLNQVVIDRRSMQELGRVEVLWMYPKAHRVLGFICKSGWLGGQKTAFNLDQVQTIGANGILVDSSPVSTDAEKVKRLESPLQDEVWTDSGNRAGRVIDYLFDWRSGEIEHYLFTSNGWGGVVGTVYLLPPNYILQHSNQRVLVAENALRLFSVYREGLQDRFTKAATVFKEELRGEQEQVTQDMRSLMNQARGMAEQAKEKVRSVAEQVQDQTLSLMEELERIDGPGRREHSDASPDRVAASGEPDPWEHWEETPSPRSGTTSAAAPPPEVKPARSDDPWDDDYWT